MANLRIAKLDAGDVNKGRALFALLAEMFGEHRHSVSDSYVEAVLRQRSFWAIAALDGEEVIGGLTAHVIAMTRSESQEMFIYDFAVRPEHQRKGVGRKLMKRLMELVALSGIADIFVLADNADAHALAFYRALGGRSSVVTCFDFSGKRLDRV